MLIAILQMPLKVLHFCFHPCQCPTLVIVINTITIIIFITIVIIIAIVTSSQSSNPKLSHLQLLESRFCSSPSLPRFEPRRSRPRCPVIVND